MRARAGVQRPLLRQAGGEGPVRSWTLGLAWEEQREGAGAVTAQVARSPGGGSLCRPLLLAFLSGPSVDRGVGGGVLGWERGRLEKQGPRAELMGQGDTVCLRGSHLDRGGE